MISKQLNIQLLALFPRSRTSWNKKMGTDLTIYCLKEITDYIGFERLCHDLMALSGYPSIEPLGGFKDKGRDAIHIDKSGGITIFAYSVREDWRAKLSEDATKIQRNGHSCKKLVFITTSEITPGQRDEAINSIKEQFKWDLDIFGLERLRILLDTQYTQLKATHTKIFPPDILAYQAQVDRIGQRNYIFISYSPENIILADWIARKLVAEGYLVWCEKIRHLGGDEYPGDIDIAMQRDVFCVIALYSESSIKNPEFIRQSAVAIGISKSIPNFYIPIRIEQIPIDKMDRTTRGLVFLPFETDWSEGIRLLLDKLENIGCPKSQPKGRRIAAEVFPDGDVYSQSSEMIVSNLFPILQLPKIILRFQTKQTIPNQLIFQMRCEWAFRQVSDRLFLSFQQPSPELLNNYGLSLVGEGLWEGIERVEGISSKNLVSELLRKGIIVYCLEKGLKYCPSTNLIYFPFGLVPGDKMNYLWPNGKTAFINTVGERKYRKGKGEERYKYYIAPDFYISQTLIGDFAVLLKIRIRITDIEGVPLSPSKSNSRRKDLCHDWWNAEWLSRTLAVCQFLSHEGKITLALSQINQIIIGATPIILTAPFGIDEKLIDLGSYEREDILMEREEFDDGVEQE